MTRLVKILPKENVLPDQNDQVKRIFTGFDVQTNRVTSREQTYLKIKGAFKILVQNIGDVDVTIFGNFRLPSYAEQSFESGDTSFGFTNDTAVNYGEASIGENIDLLITSYFKTT